MGVFYWKHVLYKSSRCHVQRGKRRKTIDKRNIKDAMLVKVTVAEKKAVIKMQRKAYPLNKQNQ